MFISLFRFARDEVRKSANTRFNVPVELDGHDSPQMSHYSRLATGSNNGAILLFQSFLVI